MAIYAKNPIMPGFYPDPSICAVGEDYYLINSTFAYFPGLPIMHSKDLVHWEQIGNAMHREEQLPLQNAGHSAGLFAPTMRYYNGTYYVICTNVSHGGNYIVTATNPAGPWSNPYYLKGADGIDPSLFFDDDGKCYYIGTHPNPEGCRYNGDYFIWIQELDINEMKLVGEVHNVWNGAMRGVHWPEGPHLYKKDGYYYIMHAEGGTGPEHAVTVCRSESIYGPYENNFCNPILTHRHMGQNYPIKYVGHADMIETPAGEWFMVMLAVRPLEGFTTMGRETFLAKVIWENGWPVVNPGVGMLTDEVEINLPEWNPAADPMFDSSANCVPGSNRTYEFAKMSKLGDEFLLLRNPGEDMYALDAEGLKLSCRSISLKEQDSPSFVAIRQQHHHFDYACTIETANVADEKVAGVCLMQSNEYHLKAELKKVAGALSVAAVSCKKKEDEVLGEVTIADTASVKLTIRVDGLAAAIFAQGADSEAVKVCDGIDVRELSTEVAGGFVGCTLGAYAYDEKDRRSEYICVKDMSYNAF